MAYFDYFNEPCLIDSYSSQLDYPLESVFNQTQSSTEMSSATLNNGTLWTPTSPPKQCLNFNTEPFNSNNPIGLDFSFDRITTTYPYTYNATPSSQSTSPTTSDCDNVPTGVSLFLEEHPPSSPFPLSRFPDCQNRDLSCLFPDTTSDATLKSSAPRKRGRPHLHRQDSESSTCSGHPSRNCTQRVPHNQVERKYREGLNAELERLRRAIPTLPQGQARLSKSMVMAGAIEYIEKIERERDAAHADL